MPKLFPTSVERYFRRAARLIGMDHDSNASSLRFEGQSMNEALRWAMAQPGDWHDSGNLAADVIQQIYEAAISYPDCVSAETGCGLSTIILSQACSHHTSFTISEGNSASKVQSEALFRSEKVEFIFGPSQRTLPLHAFNRPLNLVLIDGAHGWPFPELDYYHFYPHILPGGTLIIDDIHIPTIARLCEVLRDDSMWEHVADVRYTSFFRRTSAPLFNPTGDGWWQQNFNKRRFANPESLEKYIGASWWKI